MNLLKSLKTATAMSGFFEWTVLLKGHYRETSANGKHFIYLIVRFVVSKMDVEPRNLVISYPTRINTSQSLMKNHVITSNVYTISR